MKVEILEPKGYCSGVSHAIKVAFKAKKEHPKCGVYVFGMLVHNEYVVRKLEKEGIHTVYSFDEIPEKNVVIFTAHGHDEKLDEIAKKQNLIIYDAICPIVKKNISLIKKELADNHQIIYIGLPPHPETIAAISLDKDVLLFSIGGEFDYSKVTDESPLVVNQTTLNILELGSLHKEILFHIPQARIADEICFSTRKRQESIKNLKESEVDLIIVIGDQKSSNTTRLLEIAKMSHPTIPSVMVSSEVELDVKLLKNKKHIVLASGASVAEETIDAVFNKINLID